MKKLTDNSLKVYSYLILLSNLRDDYTRIRVFQQKDINLSKMEKRLHSNHSTIIKNLFFLEQNNLIRFKYKDFIDPALPIQEQWRLRQKQKDSYYEIDAPEQFRKIPDSTLRVLACSRNISELTYKIYIILTNYQEVAIKNKKENKFFSVQDLLKVLNLKNHTDTKERIKESLAILKGIGLIEYNITNFNNNWDRDVKVYKLKRANFFIDFDGLKTDTEVSCWSDDEIEEVLFLNKLYQL